MSIVDSIVEHIPNSDTKVLVLTGAGVSAESGVPTFRDPEGYWSKYRFEELASRDGFLKNPELVLKWYSERRKTVVSVQPNPGHYALAEWEQLLSEYTLATQNVDGLHDRAGSKRVIALHGSILSDKCFDCETPYRTEFADAEYANQRCPCGGRIRPAVVWFGEQLPEDAIYEAERAARICEVCVVIGTTGAVFPAAGLAYLAKQHDAFLIEINPNLTELSPICDLHWREKAGVALPQLVVHWKAR